MTSDMATPAPRTQPRPRWMRKPLQAFGHTAQLLRGHLVDRYGETEADAFFRDTESRYADLLPRVSWVEGRRGAVFNAFLRITAQEICVYQAVEARGGTAAEAWELCHRALRLQLAETPRWKRWLMSRLLFSGLVWRIVQRREARQELLRAGKFETRSITGDGSDFDLGIDYVRCGNLELAREVGAEAFAPYICMSDIALSDAFDWGLIRTKTLADGCSHCDFRFKRGAPTQIRSSTPEVQEVIDRIARDESGPDRVHEEPPVHPNVALLMRFNPNNVPATVDVFAEDAVFHFIDSRLPDLQGDYVGRAEIQSLFERLAALTHNTFAVHPISAEAMGDELVVAHTRNSLTLGNQPIAVDVVVVWRMVDGQIAEVWGIPSMHIMSSAGVPSSA